MTEYDNLSVHDLNNVGAALCADGRYDEGIALLLRAQSLSPDDPDFCCSLAYALAQHGETDRAVELLEHALLVQPNHAAARTILASLSVPMGSLQAETFDKQERKNVNAVLDIPTENADAAVEADADVRIPTKKRSRRLAPIFALLIVIAAVGGAWYYKHRTALVVSYSIVQTLPDTPDNRVELCQSVCEDPAALTCPQMAALLQPYRQVSALSVKGVQVGTMCSNAHFAAFESNNGATSVLETKPHITDSGATAVNDAGVVVGFEDAENPHGTVWINGKPHDLNDGLPATANLTLRDGIAIDNRGEIVATALNSTGAPIIVRLAPHRRRLFGLL